MDTRNSKKAFSVYMKDLLKEKELDEEDICIAAGIPIAFGKTVFSGENDAAHKDMIIRLCFAARFDAMETDRALFLFSGTGLSSEGRDLAIRELLSNRPRDILEFNQILHKRRFHRLITTGRQK